MQSRSRIVVAGTLLEQFLKISVSVSVRGAMFVGFWLLLYVVVGTLIQLGGWFDLPYRFLSTDKDPFFITTMTFAGVFISQGGGSLLLYHFLTGFDDEHAQVAILMGFIGLGFGGGLLRITLPAMIELVLNFI